MTLRAPAPASALTIPLMLSDGRLISSANDFPAPSGVLKPSAVRSVSSKGGDARIPRRAILRSELTSSYQPLISTRTDSFIIEARRWTRDIAGFGAQFP